MSCVFSFFVLHHWETDWIVSQTLCCILVYNSVQSQTLCCITVRVIRLCIVNHRTECVYKKKEYWIESWDKIIKNVRNKKCPWSLTKCCSSDNAPSHVSFMFCHICIHAEFKQGWEFALWLFESIACFVWAKEGFGQKKRTICSFALL